MKRMKKLLAFLLAAMLLLTMIPISASAAGDGEVDQVHLINIDDWVSSVCERVGVKPADYYNGISRLFVYGSDGELYNPSGAAATGYVPNTHFYADIGDRRPENIERIVLQLTSKGKQIVAVFSKSRGDFTFGDTGGTPGIEYVEISLTEAGKARPAGHQVDFWIEPNGELGTYTLYDTIYVEDGEKIGDQMPTGTPPVGQYEFLGWQSKKDGGHSVGSNTYVYSDMDVYAAKGTKGQTNAQIYHIMKGTNSRPQALYEEVADRYNEANNSSTPAAQFKIEQISVTGQNGATNPAYTTNEWKAEDTDDPYYYIYNVPAYAADSDPQYKNERVPVNEITGITVYGTVNSKSFTVFIPVAELDTPEATANVTVEIRVREKLDGITKELVTSADTDAPPVEGVTYPDNDSTVTVEKGEGITLMYKLTVTGDTGAAYKITDDGATVVSDYSLNGKIGHTGEAVVYVTKTFTAAEVENKTLTNTASVKPGDEVTLPADEDDGDDEDTSTITAEVEDDEEEEPDKPDADDIIEALGKDAVKVVCDNTEATHNPTEKSYDLEKGTFTYEVGEGNLITIKLSEDYGTYLTKFNGDTKVTHEFKNAKVSEAYVTFTLKGDTWTADVTKPLFTIYVTCKDGGGGEDPGDDGEKPNPPTEDELKALLDDKITVECVNDDADHSTPTKTYGFLENGIALNAVDQDKDGTSWTTEITIIGAVYSQRYSEDVGDAHKLTSDTDKNPTIQLKWVPNQGTAGGSWTLDEPDPTVTFEVICDVKTITTPGGTIVIEKDPEDPTDPDQTGVSDLLETDDHIQYLFGYPDGSFGPDRNMTRAEAAQMFYNLLKNQNVDAEPAFDDVPDGAWYATPVNVMAELGIVNGVGDDKFEPNREITRAEFTTMAMRFAKVPSGGVNIFTDVAPSDWFYSYVVNSIQYGWIEGYGDGTFRPDRLITRAEVTTIVNRMLDRQADMAFVIQNRDKLTKFTDLTTEHWAYYTIVEATNEHNYKKPATGEDWTSLK